MRSLVEKNSPRPLYFLFRDTQPYNPEINLHTPLKNKSQRLRYKERRKINKLLKVLPQEFTLPRTLLSLPSSNFPIVKIIYLFYKAKKNNYYFTATNFKGEVVASCSGGQILTDLRLPRNKKQRASATFLTDAIKFISLRLRQKKFFKIHTFFYDNLQPKELNVVQNYFKRYKVLINRVSSLVKTPHGHPFKEKKARRL